MSINSHYAPSTQNTKNPALFIIGTTFILSEATPEETAVKAVSIKAIPAASGL